MILDRTIAPPFRVIDRISLPPAETLTLDNGLPLHVINIGDQPVVRLECMFEAGNWSEAKPGAAHFAIKMLTEGTAARSSAEISEAFDRVGAFTEMKNTFDQAGVVVYCLARFLPEVLPIVHELLTEATFPRKEWDDLRNITLQNHRVNWEKNAYRATALFREKLYGLEHPYGRGRTEESISAMAREDALTHYQSNIQSSRYRIILSGKVGRDEIATVNAFLGKDAARADAEEPTAASFPILPGEKTTIVERSESIQSSIRLGKRLFTRHHPDYYQMLVVSEILGGYFGSRLMKNIREEKGLTYGISSNAYAFREDGYFVVSTDVKKEFTQQTLDEIRKEIAILQTIPVPKEELRTVKNFLAGEFAGSLNTAFDVADRQKILITDGLPADFYDRYIRQIHATTAEDIMQIAQKHLVLDDMTEVVVGGK
ncbi:M16 family metallopeptidase [Persicitalea jodogahamensis]|uniref:Zinc protease n=1 Tax=Persicitalea jodogahamensis TaxID=402147 RepID=A0A8J3D2G1_9BACT|nr:pitrilysin family protein [Persicitalea jodogahamensis]GHB53134.1 zinc protease [Persicitalea jodogahamensis]